MIKNSSFDLILIYITNSNNDNNKNYDEKIYNELIKNILYTK
jgi:hypothetical protein